MKKRYFGILGLSLIATLASCGSSNSGGNTNTGSDVEGNTEEIDIEDDDISGDFTLVNESGDEISPSNGVYTISAAGIYTASGKLSSGQIYVDAAEAEVELDLNGVSMTSSSVSPIFVNTCADFTLKSIKDTSNYIYDTRTTDYSETTDETIGTAAVYSADGDIKLNGKGTLSIISSTNSGVHSKDNVTVKNVTMLIKAQNNGIKGNDKVTIEEDPTIGIVCGNNGIKTSNSEVGTNAQHGSIYINGGTITINSYGDGVDAAYGIYFGTSTDSDGTEYTPTIDVYTNIYSSYTVSSTSSYTVSLTGFGGGTPGDNGFDGGGTTGGTSAEKADESAKAFKANETIDITCGDIFAYTYDDALHTNNDTNLDSGATPSATVNISGGELNLKASDDGLHADGTLTISGGTVYIAESYEGVEGNKIVISGGETTVYADNDAVNASSSLVISGGRVDVNMAASGDCDGLDSNGTFSITGGTIITRGPNSDMASAIDTDSTVSITGGTVIILGYCNTSGMSASKMTLTKSSSAGLSSGSHTVTVGSTTVSYSNSYTYSGTCYVYASGSATIK
ncbi:MAG: carbohydrate-binding domain-containing protein [Acholeplasmatales bacterium]|nr:carbohydrate-binding domain-containing protein [Acholeplasmatales bacterium]